MRSKSIYKFSALAAACGDIDALKQWASG